MSPSTQILFQTPTFRIAKAASSTVQAMTGSSAQVPFGRQFRQTYFEFDPAYIPLNHGSFGATPIPVLDAAAAEQRECRANTDLYLRYKMEAKMEPARQKLCEVLDADPLNMVFVANATIGVNTILRSMPLEKGDVVIAASTTYGACANTLRFLEERVGIVPVFIKIKYPMSSDEIVQAYENAIKESEGPVKFGFFDAVSSMPAARLPWERLVELCKQYNVMSIVDAAHCVGLLPDVSLNTVRPDFFITNIHKWFFTPAPAALMYVDPKHHRSIQTFPISWTYTPEHQELPTGTEKTLLQAKFGFVGTIDYTNYIVAAKAAEFRQEVCGGEHAIIKYNSELASKGAALFAKELNGEVFVGSGPEDTLVTDTSMTNVYLSFAEYDIPVEDYPEAIAELQAQLVQKYNVFIQFSLYNGRPLIRLSGQVYLEMADFEDGVKALKAALKDYQRDLVPEFKRLSVKQE